MMTIHLTHADYDAAHLAAVSEEMRTLGAPTIRAIRGDVNVWYALEGCHRLRAAHALGLIPTIEEVEYSDTVMASDLGLRSWPRLAGRCADRHRHRRIASGHPGVA